MPPIPKIPYDNPVAMWAGIISTIAFSYFSVEANTQDRFTGDDGRQLQAELRAANEEIDKLEDYVELLAHRGPVDVRQGQRENTALLKETQSLMSGFVEREVAVRAQHEDLETLVREILREQRENCRMKI